MIEERTDVLIVGGSLVGLSMSMFLAANGVPATLVERRPTTSDHPRAWGFNPRTVELMREAGLEAAVRRAEDEGMPAPAREGGLLKVESLMGQQVMWLREALPDLTGVSPVQWVMCGQDRIEPIVRARAEELGSRHRFGSNLLAFAADQDGVTALIRQEPAEDLRVRARYLVAADGARGATRERLGIGLSGAGPLSQRMAIVFRADLTEALRGRRFTICFIVNEHIPGGVLLPVDSAHGWQLDVPYHPDRGESPDDFTDERCVELVRAAVGQPGLPVTVSKRLPWTAGARIADRFRSGRVFLVGDAAHIMPPTGALGANTGIQDAHNLSWKLAAVLRGAASPALLDTYDAERRPVAQFTIQQAVARFVDRGRQGPPGGPPPAPPRDMVDDLTVWLGYCYAPGNGMGEDPRHPSASPGTRAPHVRLRRDGREISSLDLFGRRFVLLAAEEDGWCEAARRAAGRLGVELEAHRVGADMQDAEGRWRKAYRLPPSGAVLVRPDGFVGWRADAPSADPESDVAGALSQLLGRP